MNVYFGASLFNEKDLTYNASLADKIRKEIPNINLYLPQENKSINDKSNSANSIKIFEADTEKLEKVDILFCNLDDDLGLACEIGYFVSLAKKDKNKKIIAIFSDSRDGSLPHAKSKEELLSSSIAESQFCYINLYLIGAIKSYGKIFHSSSEAINYLKELAIN